MDISVRLCDDSNRIERHLCRIKGTEDVRTLMEHIERRLGVPLNRQRLIANGRKLECGNRLMFYKLCHDPLIDLSIRPEFADEPSRPHSPSSDKSDKKPVWTLKESNYFTGSDLVDALEPETGSWFEAKLVAIGKYVAIEDDNAKVLNDTESDDTKENQSDDIANDDLIYKVKFKRNNMYDEDSTELRLCHVRPQAHRVVAFEKVEVGRKYMVNYNFEEQKERGYFYDFVITHKSDESRKTKLVEGTLTVGTATASILENCRLTHLDAIYDIPKLVTVRGRDRAQQLLFRNGSTLKRIYKAECDRCRDDPTKLCKHCSCHVCGGKDIPEKQLTCDECHLFFHLWCLDPPMEKIPEEEFWYCDDCKNETQEELAAKAQEALFKVKRNVEKSGQKVKDISSGMQCQGKRRTSSVVSSQHFGPIPNVEVGMRWRYRNTVSEYGVHTPVVAGISGSLKIGAYSICLSGGYEDDTDEGYRFIYTGSGGRDLSQNKRTNIQSRDQELTLSNLALALNCNAKLNNVQGAKATNWKGGKPVRVLRSYKAHPQFAPPEGFRYDGIYKVVQYWCQTGLNSEFKVWRYLLQRDDPNPAPWTPEGIKFSKEQGHNMIYPIGFVPLVNGRKRNSDSDAEDSDISSGPDSKRARLDDNVKPKAYVVPAHLKQLMEQDIPNATNWEECLKMTQHGKTAFVEKLEDIFKCPLCLCLFTNPITLDCSHSCCQSCLKRCMDMGKQDCLMCRADIKRNFDKLKINDILKQILMELFPGYAGTG